MNKVGKNWTWVRWALVLPAAVAAFFASQLVGIVLTLFAPDLWSQLINSALGGYAFVYIGARTAPREATAIAVVLAVIFYFQLSGRDPSLRQTRLRIKLVDCCYFSDCGLPRCGGMPPDPHCGRAIANVLTHSWRKIGRTAC